MHLSRVIHILGLLLMFQACTMLLPLPFCFYYASGDHTAFLLSAAITFVCGGIAYRFTRIDRDLLPKEGFAVVTFSWLALSAFGALPFVLSGAIPSYTDAFFETMSGLSTTGASILTDIEALPRGALFWRSLNHWIGGMGIIVLSLAILPFLGVGGMQLFKAEIPGPVVDKLTPRITETAKILWAVYFALTVAEALLLMFGGLDLFDALCHTFGTMATGGFSTRNASVAAYDSAYIEYVIIFFMLIAGANFSLHFHALRGQWRGYLRNREFHFYLSLIGMAFLVISASSTFRAGMYPDWEEAFRKTLFQVVSIITTTGYGTADYELWSFTAQFVLFSLMFVGGCAGSTGGGMKVMRIHLLVKFVSREITRLVHPRAVVPVRMGGHAVDRDVVANVLGFFVLFMFSFAGGVFIMSELGMDMPTSFGAVAATLGNVGPGLGAVGPTDNYSAVPAAGKWVLSLLMLMGRLEIYTVIVLLSPATWQR
ncbi:MAG: TrkH family potassium uptake protein [bacterium]|nr:TrkH family potassium uptake protein [bacterium]